MKKIPDDQKINAFWDWFAENDPHIRAVLLGDSDTARESLKTALDNQVLEFGLFTWEIGPLDRRFFLNLSPNGSKELLLHSKRIIESAPDLYHWEFRPSRPPHPKPELVFSLPDEQYIERKIDASEWKFVWEGLPPFASALIIQAPELLKIDPETQKTALNRILTAILGEERRINEVPEIRIVAAFDKELASSAKGILELGH